MTTSERMRMYAPVVLRIGMALVFLYFSSQQFLHTQMWLGLIPKNLVGIFGTTAVDWVHLNASIELVFGLCLFFGFFERVTTVIMTLHMISIMLTVGYTAIGVRDFGLSIAMISLFLYGSDFLTFDRWFSTRNSQKSVQM